MISTHNKYFSLIIFAAVLYLIFLLIKPFISIILGSVVLSYAFYPLHKRVARKIRRPGVSAGVTTILIFLIILIPLIFVLNLLTIESISTYQTLKNQDVTGLVTSFVDKDLSIQLKEVVDKVLLFFVETSSKIVLSIPQIVLNFFLLFFLMFYLLKDGKKVAEIIRSHFPSKNKQVIFDQFDKLTKALIYGTILIAIIQGVLGGIGFLIFDISSPILWGTAMAIASFVPMIGTAIIWLPAGIFKLIQGNIISGVGILLFGFFIISTVDNLVRPYFVSSRAKVHPAIVFLGVLGGLQLFGFTGIIIGPLFLALALEYIGIKDVSLKS
jgi:predicted PurR-regulated permease PerM